MRILIVDDELPTRIFLREIIQENGKGDDILEAVDGEEALRIIQEKPDDLVITDLKMAKISGMDVLEKVKQNSPCTEVIVITGYASIDTAIQAMRKGARDYLKKPLNIKLFNIKIENIRDYVDRLKEIDDYRFAKDIFEANVSRSLFEMEQVMQNYQHAIRKIRQILTNESENTKKLSQISDLISEISIL